MWAAARGHTEIVREIMNYPGVDITLQDSVSLVIQYAVDTRLFAHMFEVFGFKICVSPVILILFTYC